MPRLRVLAGPSFSDLTPMQANDDSVFDIKTDAFEGKITVYIKGFADADGNIGDSPYFKQEERKDVTWSIQVQGQYIRLLTTSLSIQVPYSSFQKDDSSKSILPMTSCSVTSLTDI